MQRLLEQVARRFVYIVMTAAIAVPVWLATRPHLGDRLAGRCAARTCTTAGTAGGTAQPRGTVRIRTQPVVASLTALPPRPAAAPALSLRFNGDSWVEVTAPDGRMLEQGTAARRRATQLCGGRGRPDRARQSAAVNVQRNGQVQST